MLDRECSHFQSIFLLAALVVSSGCTQSRIPPAAAPTRSPPSTSQPSANVLERWRANQPIRVLVLGNSISLGYYADGWERLQLTAEGHLTPESEADESVNGVITQLRRFIRSRNPASVVKNESGNGYTAKLAHAWLDRILPSAPPYDLAFLPLVANDANQGFQVAAYERYLQLAIDRLVAARIVPVLVKENDIYDLPEGRFGTPYSAFMAAIDRLAAANQLSVVDGYTPFDAAVVAGGGIEASGLFHIETHTGLHPNQAGHNILFRAYERWFKR